VLLNFLEYLLIELKSVFFDIFYKKLVHAKLKLIKNKKEMTKRQKKARMFWVLIKI
jgi:hypothetical protein